MNDRLAGRPQDGRILILRNQPRLSTLHQHEGADMPLSSMLNSVGHRERAHDTGNGSDSDIGRWKPNVHLINRVSCSLKERSMNRAYLLQRRIAAPSAAPR
jgi:hypothetical protein